MFWLTEGNSLFHIIWLLPHVTHNSNLIKSWFNKNYQISFWEDNCSNILETFLFGRECRQITSSFLFLCTPKSSQDGNCSDLISHWKLLRFFPEWNRVNLPIQKIKFLWKVFLDHPHKKIKSGETFVATRIGPLLITSTWYFKIHKKQFTFLYQRSYQRKTLYVVKN